MPTCARSGYLVDGRGVIPSDPTDLAVERLPIVGCSQIACSKCGVRVKHVVGMKFPGNRPPTDLAPVFADPPAHLEPSGTPFRLYLCECSSWTESSEHPLYDRDPDPMRDPTMPWECAGHPAITLPADIDGVSVRTDDDLRDVAKRVLGGWNPPESRAADHERVCWLRRLYARLAPEHARVLARAVFARVTDPDPDVRGRVLSFGKNVSDRTLLHPLVAQLEGDRALFRSVPDRISSVENETLEDSLWRVVAPLASDGRVRALARMAARTPGRGRRALFDVMAAHDLTWLVANVEPIARANRDQVGELILAISNYADDDVMFAAEDRAEKVAADKTRRARTLPEMLFAASLVPCPSCGARTGKLDLRGDGDAWVLFGPCPSCGTARSFQFATEGNPREQMYERLELGDGRPSQVIEPAQLVAELARLEPQLRDDPRGLAPADWYAHGELADRAYTAAVELAKFLPPTGGDVPGLGAPHTRDWIERERDRATERLERIFADAPRVWLARQGSLGAIEEIRGLVNQGGRRLRPSLADLRAYFAPRAKRVSEFDGGIHVELATAGIDAIRLWDDAAGVHGEITLAGLPAGEVQTALLGATTPVDLRREADLVRGVTVHFARSQSAS